MKTSLLNFLSSLQTTFHGLWRYRISLTLFAVLFIAIFPRSTVLEGGQFQQIAVQTSAYHFGFVGWELDALRSKLDTFLFGQHVYLDEAQRSDFVRQYMADLNRVRQLNAQIEAIYIDPAIDNPDVASAELQHERNTLRDDLERRKPITEAILEGQVATILVEEGFGIAGQLFPPMAMKFTQAPDLLVVSPRQTIQLDISLPLIPTTVDERAAIETDIEAQHDDVSTLVVSLGGIALYPAMIYETASISRAVEVFAHEWLHHYLYFYPLGLSYITGDGLAGDARIINETTADYFGKEIAIKVLARYYPDVPSPTLPEIPTENSTQPTPQRDSNAFDFGAEMNVTRITVDDLLENDEVETAEAYMEERRQFFYENGYRIRKLNQAYFAFYGGYQAGGGGGAGGANPIGPAVIEIRQNSETVYDFILTMRRINGSQMLFDQFPDIRNNN